MKNSIIKLLLSSVCIFIVFGVIVFASEQPAVNIEVDENNNSSIEISDLSFDVYAVQLELIVDKSNNEYKFTPNNKNSYSLLTQEPSGSKTKLTIYLDSKSVLNSENKINVGNISNNINPNFSATGKLILLNEKLRPTEYDDIVINTDYSNTTTDSEQSTESTSKESTETTTNESTETTTTSSNSGGSSSGGGGGSSSLGRYKITAEAKEGGNIEPKGDIYISRGTNKLFTFIPDKGYIVDSVKVNGISVNIKDNTYTMENIKSNMSIIVSFKKSNEKEPLEEDKKEEVSVSKDKDEKFSDVNNHWAKEAIYYLADKGIVNGITENIFAPNNNITRAEFVTLLAKTSEIDIYNYTELPFKDVIKNDWYAPFVAWAYENGIVKGIDNETFSPKSFITREQMAVMICNYINYANIETVKEEKSDFNDSNLISDYALDSVKEVHYAGIISGKDNYMFAPKENATRAESATIIYNLIK